ncbi:MULTISPECIES: DUF493 family protein [Pandoraea]|uniref:UPF0250 protein ABW99_14670 n=1 Tax=Pandoraea thiooxydans TaxID=445709 RepID=A0A0G3EWW7_9BURK|nr:MULTISPECIES: DUF493 family protein [Pandoraea]MBU6493200.1 DUF493 family protein [Burkholderiales bacterium]AKJ69271.1 hypothetical protein ABW99_14670 [Pandoraea thiooxydans]APR96881.1 hypothetical protein PATSB16_35450 [Pandoraea thiooxydans]MDE2288051.1 DUF493 family protein [Burkholderiales bacterium]MDE2610811.1 DUF493 family protein [Burkholderiales bacterium]
MSPVNETLLEFPCDFPIKVMGRMQPEFAQSIAQLMQQFDAEFDAARIEMRPSRAGNYLGLTVTVRATSRAHLDDIYRALTAHPMVTVVL